MRDPDLDAGRGGSLWWWFVWAAVCIGGTWLIAVLAEML